jgi:hypothetical protein
MRMYGRREKLSPEQTAANAKARYDRAKATMTCQCCAKSYLANTGVMAHHGYQRPGGGWQTASCSGARELPFEVSRDALGRLIVGLNNWKANAVSNRTNIEKETAPVVLTISDRSKPRDRFGRYPSKHIDVTRANFAALSEEYSFYRLGHYDFDHVKERDLAHRDREIKAVTEEIAAQRARFYGWTQTHDWDASAKAWLPLRKEG